MFFTRKFARLLKITTILCLLCFFCIWIPSEYSTNSSISVQEYKEYLQGYINKLPIQSNSNVNDDTQKEFQHLVSGENKEDIPSIKKNTVEDFYNVVFQNIIDYSPSGKTARNYSSKCKLDQGIASRPDSYKDWEKLSMQNLLNCLEVSPEEFTNLSTSHHNFVEHVNKLVLPKGTYNNDGIVMVGGGKFTFMAYLVLKTLRNQGTTLPVEIFIPPIDTVKEETFCKSEMLSELSAKCIYMSNILPQEMIEKFDFKGYQFKSLAIIASSFENLLLLDADNFPIKSLDKIFKHEPYNSTGLVMWPDFWRRTTQPIYYKLADIYVNVLKRVRNDIDDITPTKVYSDDNFDFTKIPFHDFEGTMPDDSTESGQLMINKSKHLPTVLLALYYNVNGPNWYYPIFSQNAHGEGDKETFIAAATFYRLPFYQVRTKVGADGYHTKDRFQGVAMAQHDFIQDYEHYQIAQREIKKRYSNVKDIKYDAEYAVQKFYDEFFNKDTTKYGEIDIMFLHSNLPKFDPLKLWEDSALIDETGKHFRSFSDPKIVKKYDIEYENFKIIKDVICDKGIHFSYLDEELQEKPQDWVSMCQYIKDRYIFLKDTHQDATSPVVNT
ncbi:alpha-1,2-mannosyltransferase MNN2 NDAI_0G01790 [Naumovozyma dairenensis CBS 421]|uniref:Alpha-1,2-mannosyltransferase MNN2 n=1 Tax=Naumovozyma dairenensis (strain ATCC 10597 / BCRC 20456 / CBS 421 / NBRC 0211 / NRRL Y-12639) TaxID=1071378 RepID=G0WDU4_NAUDC|nr:hypothetical protein NDAI_0G01790 [Naumovozyma dairenensis CBS 421]CCD25955.2 hypothetical protein NDAI_0G01790 [Naumovozyma dairenensis CBS 421]